MGDVATSTSMKRRRQPITEPIKCKEHFLSFRMMEVRGTSSQEVQPVVMRNKLEAVSITSSFAAAILIPESALLYY